jgi:tyrosine-protein phosphatase non-receptor type 23
MSFKVCLAQAQECILEKSILDNRKAGIIAKVGAQVADYYKQAFKKIETSNGKTDLQEDTIFEVVGKELSKGWTGYVHFKMAFYIAVSHYYMGVQAEEATKMGEAVAYFAHASKSLVEAGDLAKNLNSKMVDRTEVTNCLVFTSDVIDGKLENAKKKNEFIYHEKVPEFESLAELKGASLVKGMGFEVSDNEISGPDIFSRLVPMEAHEASSLYSEEKAQILRQLGDLVEERDAELAVVLSSLRMEEIPNPGDHIALPQELIEVAAGLSMKDNAVKKLTDAMARIAAVSADVQASLNEIKEILVVSFSHSHLHIFLNPRSRGPTKKII